MGKAQSKRSVDITTETKKGAEDEVTEKMEKIEDLDKKEVLNGDATLEEKHDPQKKDNEEVENDKDMTTEKNVDIQAGGDSTEASNSAETPKDEGEPATAEEISPLADESAKKSKKEKVKKKWSFRSISFGKKDKQKPSKNEEALDDGTPAINGAETDEKSSNETEDPQKEKNVNEEVEKSTENRENGDASQQELNGTAEHKEEMTSEEKSNVITSNLTNNTTTERCAPVQSDNTVEPTEQSEKTEPAVTSTTNNETNISENNTTIEVPKNGNGEFEELNATEHDLQKPDVTTASIDTSTEKKSISTDATNELSASTNGEKIHQNGDNIDQEIVEQSKAQIEVNSKTENKVFAATLDSFPSTSINPSNAQIQIKDLNASTKNVDENFKINIDEPVIPKFSDIERVKSIIIPTSSISESVETVEGSDYNKQVEESALLPIEIIETETTLVTADKITEPSPPPLPISPPPSQVSVFVFTNNEESVEDSLSTNSPKPVDSAINEENKEILFNPLEVLPDSASLETDIPENNENPDETTVMNNEEISECVENKLIEEKTSFEEIMCTTNSLSNKLRNEEEISIAAAVINEITEHAAEIVNQHLEINEYESVQKTELTEDSSDKINNEVEHVDHKGLAEDNNARECSNDKSAEYLIESAIVPSQTIDSITDSSLTFSPQELTPQAQNEVISLSVE